MSSVRGARKILGASPSADGRPISVLEFLPAELDTTSVALSSADGDLLLSQ